MHLETFMGRSLGGHNWCVADQRIVNTRIRDQVGLELVQVDVQGAIKAQAGSHGRHYLSDEAIQVLIVGSRDIKAATADVVHGLVINQECAVGMLDGAVGGENSVVGFDN